MKKPNDPPDVIAIIGISENYLYWNAKYVPVIPPMAAPTHPPIKNPMKKFFLMTYDSPNIRFIFLSHRVSGLFFSAYSFKYSSCDPKPTNPPNLSPSYDLS
jgi:hypothetical protein